MVSLHITIKKGKKNQYHTVEFDADKFEKLAALFGLFNSDFLKSLARSEKDIKAGRITKLKSLKDLR
ncbi:MAG: hypothetical protein Q8Q48_03675 [Candidatus Staskawiczbacteria bacterium]|nr:hypothetical protein [Candidatus Staskawiczbacteria bacterium]